MPLLMIVPIPPIIVTTVKVKNSATLITAAQLAHHTGSTLLYGAVFPLCGIVGSAARPYRNLSLLSGAR